MKKIGKVEILNNLLKRDDISYATKASGVHILIAVTGEEVKRRDLIRFLQFEGRQSHPTAVKSIKELESIGFIVKKDPNSYKFCFND